MELQNLSFVLLLLTVFVQCSDSKSSHSLRRREADPEVNYDEEVLGDEALNDNEALNDAEGEEEGEDEPEQQHANVSIVSFGEHFAVDLGRTVRLPCVISPPGTAVIVWTKDNDAYFQGTVKVSAPEKVTRDNDDIIIANVDKSDVGTYKCRLYGEGEHQQEIEHTLEIREPPKIIRMTLEGGENRIAEGSDVIVTCDTTGVPPPTLIWSRESSKGENYKLTEKDAEFVANGIMLRRVTKAHSGKYICYADNKVGIMAFSSVTLKVLGKPHVHVPSTVINSAPGVEALLKCTVHEEAEDYINWYKEGKLLSGNSQTYNIVTGKQKSDLTVRPVGAEEFGTYTCEAVNTYGKHQKSVKLVMEPVIEYLDGEGSKLEWLVISHLPLSDMQISYRKTNETEWRTDPVFIPQPIDGHKYEIKHEISELDPGSYEAIVRAKNDASWSDHSITHFFNHESQSRYLQQASVFRRNGNQTGDAHSLRPVVSIFLAIKLIIWFL